MRRSVPCGTEATGLQSNQNCCASEPSRQPSEMRAYPISTRVNGVKNDDATLLDAVS